MKVKTYNPRLSASIQSKKGRRYQLVYRIDAGKPVWKTLDTYDLKTAQIEADKMVRKIEGELIGGLRLSEILERWIKYNSKDKSDWYIKDVHKHYGNFIKFFKDCFVGTLVKEDILKYKSDLEGRNLSQSSISVSFRTIKSVWNWARDNEYIEKDLFFGFKIPRVKSRKEWLTVKQLQRVIRAARDNILYQGFIEFLVVTGFRIGELYKLKWADIYDTHIVLKDTKKRETELVTMRPQFRKILEKIWDNQRVHRDFVFSDEIGKHLSYYTLSAMVKRYLIKAGFSEYVPHHLRHSYGSNLVVKKTDIYRIKELMRHNDVRTTQRYAKITGSDITDDEADIFPKSKPLFVKKEKVDKFFEIEEGKDKSRWRKND